MHVVVFQTFENGRLFWRISVNPEMAYYYQALQHLFVKVSVRLLCFPQSAGKIWHRYISTASNSSFGDGRFYLKRKTKNNRLKRMRSRLWNAENEYLHPRIHIRQRTKTQTTYIPCTVFGWTYSNTARAESPSNIKKLANIACPTDRSSRELGRSTRCRAISAIEESELRTSGQTDGNISFGRIYLLV